MQGYRNPIQLPHRQQEEDDNVRMQAIAAKAETTMKIKCLGISLYCLGSHHKIYRLQMTGGRRLIARVRSPWLRHYGAGISPDDTMESEIATMKYVKAYTSIPVPHIYLHDKDPTNIVGGEWMLFDEVQGNNLAVVWPSLTPEQRRKICLAIVGIWTELARTRFDAIGSIRMKKENPSIFYVGPLAFIPSRSENDIGPPNPARCGPFPTARTWLTAMARQDLAFIRKKSFNSQERMRISETLTLVSNSPQTHLDTKWTGPMTTPLAANVLRHVDLQFHNIIVDISDPTVIKGVIDWEGAMIVPLWSLRPEFLMSVDAQKGIPPDVYLQLRTLCLRNYVLAVPEWTKMLEATKEVRRLYVRAVYSQCRPEEEFLQKLMNSAASPLR